MGELKVIKGGEQPDFQVPEKPTSRANESHIRKRIIIPQIELEMASKLDLPVQISDFFLNLGFDPILRTEGRQVTAHSFSLTVRRSTSAYAYTQEYLKLIKAADKYLKLTTTQTGLAETDIRLDEANWKISFPYPAESEPGEILRKMFLHSTPEDRKNITVKIENDLVTVKFEQPTFLTLIQEAREKLTKALA